MASNRANLDQSQSIFPLTLFSVILLSLSLLGAYYLFTLNPVIQDNSSLPTPSPTIIPTILPVATSTIIIPKATPTIQTLLSEDEKFSVSYHSSRKLYTETESGGHRYTLYSPEGNITIHAGSIWSWTHPDRQFTSTTRVSGQDTFVYEVSNQTLIDFQKSSLVYTIQCVHFGNSEVKAECQQFLSDFKLL